MVGEADAVAPVPLHRSRLLARRFNQAAEIARPLARTAGLDYLPDALIRSAPTDSQGGKSARGRRLNVKSAFAVSETGRRAVKGRRILLIDDVLTTGATAEACTRALLDAEERPVWWVEADEDATLLVVDALAMDLKQRLVDLEDVHPLGAWFNLDLVTEMPDGTRSAWHHSPMRPEPRLLPTLGLEDALDGYDWS